MKDVAEIMRRIAAEYTKYQCEPDTIPSAPDTSKFRAIRSGMIRYERNVSVYYSGSGTSINYPHFVKIGSLVPWKIRREIIQKVRDQVGGNRFGTTEGTNWGGIGWR